MASYASASFRGASGVRCYVGGYYVTREEAEKKVLAMNFAYSDYRRAKAKFDACVSAGMFCVILMDKRGNILHEANPIN